MAMSVVGHRPKNEYSKTHESYQAAMYAEQTRLMGTIEEG